jgi:bifunctional non-homologous end joining protein LigD
VSLKEYQRKRDFGRTSEPKGRKRTGYAGNLYVIQKHAARRLHYDFRLELDGVLKSWALPKGPSCDPAEKRLAVQVEDHPLEYGDFEGIIPKSQYGGGTVMLWDRGHWEGLGDYKDSFRRGKLKFKLNGQKLRGGWTLVRMKGKAAEGGKNWLLIKERDDQARNAGAPDVLDEFPDSIVSGRSMDKIAADRDKRWQNGRTIEEKPSKKKSIQPAKQHKSAKGTSHIEGITAADLPGARKRALPSEFKPQLATLVSEVPRGQQWLHEIKFDGYRVLCTLSVGKVRLVSRNGNDLTRKLSTIAKAAGSMPVSDGILDGEVVAVRPDGSTNFQVLQNALKEGTGANLAYYLFDLPFCDGYDLRRTPLIERKRLLHQLIRSRLKDDSLVRYSDHVEGRGPTIYEHACTYVLEGVISKRADSEYQSRRTRSWVKTKCSKRQEFVICGYTDPDGSRTGFGALLLGYQDDEGNLVYCGRVGTGFNAQTLKRIRKQLVERAQKNTPFRSLPNDFARRGVHWVRPELVAEVTFANWTDDGLLRHASFQGMREDKKPSEVVREEPATSPAQKTAASSRPRGSERLRSKRTSRTRQERNVVAGQHLTHPDRILYPEQGLTKRDLAVFYEHIADWILPHVTSRLLSLVRCPQGRRQSCFFQKHVNETLPDALQGVSVEETSKRSTYITIHDLSGLIALVQLGVLEIHVWGSREDKPDKPDRLVFDLDPGLEVGWTTVVEGAQMLRDRLKELGLKSFVKTSGGKGLHVVVPLARRIGWDELKAFSKAVAVDVAREEPKRYIATMSKTKRKGKIFIDYLRNGRGSTTVAAYSTRARATAPVSTPLTWDELESVKGAAVYTVVNLSQRLNALKDDPWAGFFDVRQFITAKMRRQVDAD